MKKKKKKKQKKKQQKEHSNIPVGLCVRFPHSCHKTWNKKKHVILARARTFAFFFGVCSTSHVCSLREPHPIIFAKLNIHKHTITLTKNSDNTICWGKPGEERRERGEKEEKKRRGERRENRGDRREERPYIRVVSASYIITACSLVQVNKSNTFRRLVRAVESSTKFHWQLRVISCDDDNKPATCHI